MPTSSFKRPLDAATARKGAADQLMTLAEVAAKLNVSRMTVHRLPLPSIRIGRALRFDPRDVRKLIARSKEALA